jgi:hypothetical protein
MLQLWRNKRLAGKLRKPGLPYLDYSMQKVRFFHEKLLQRKMPY